MVAWGGLGRFIVDGFAQRDDVQIFAGAILVAALAMVAELALAGLQWLATPRPMRASMRWFSRPGRTDELVLQGG